MIIILGPTAVGKSSLALEIAKKINGEIISADSMQVYRGMDIGTAKPPKEQRREIPHYLIDIRNPDESWTVADFIGESIRIAEGLVTRGKAPIIVGGTGLYLWSLLEGFHFPITPADKELRAGLEKQSAAELYEQLSAVDSTAADKIHPNDKKRIIRALEVYRLTGKPISKLQEPRRLSAVVRRTKEDSVAGSEPLLIGFDLPRGELYERINHRVDAMIEKGLVEEVKGLLAKGYSKDLFSFQALGYKEAIEYLEGRWTLDEMTEELKKRTRNFARRQMTWFRRFKNVHWFSPFEIDAILKLCAKPSG